MKAWNEFCALLKKDIGEKAFARWISPLLLLRYDACNIYLEARDSFSANWFNEHVKAKANRSLVNENNKKIKVHLSIKNEVSFVPDAPENTVRHSEVSIKESASFLSDGVDPFSTFEHFFVCEKNLLAFKLLSQLTGYNASEIKPHEFNPIYIWGTSGSGKTHLLMSCVHEYAKRGIKVCYTRAESFTDNVVNAIRSGEMQKFRQSYRTNDVLIIDDIHTFSRKAATQEELFHTFNTLHLAGKQIILGANCSPGELQAIEPRLVSRFEWGIAIPIEAYSKEDIASILAMKSKALGITLPSHITQFLLETFSSSVKSLMRALEALILRTHLKGEFNQNITKTLTIPTVKHHLRDLIKHEEAVVITPEKIILNVAEYFGIRPEDILSDSQNRERTVPRQIAMALCRMELNIPYARIGRIFSRDHSTVMSSIKLVDKNVNANNADFSVPLHSIQKRLHSQEAAVG